MPSERRGGSGALMGEGLGRMGGGIVERRLEQRESGGGRWHGRWGRRVGRMRCWIEDLRWCV